MMSFIENSKQAGQIVALVSALAIVGMLSYIAATAPVASPTLTALNDKWMLLIGIIFGFYFGTTSATKKKEG